MQVIRECLGTTKPASRAFTLVEVLVTITMVAVVLSLLLPAFFGLRSAADRIVCQTRLKTLTATLVSVGEARQQRWPLWIEPDQYARTAEFNGDVWGMTYYMQAWGWSILLRETIQSVGPPPSEWLCPTQVRTGGMAAVNPSDGAVEPAKLFDRSPLSGATTSFAYSVALMSDPRAWMVRGNQLPRMAAAKASVRFDQVSFPASKAVFSESWARHGNLRPREDPKADVLNIAFSDGHVAAHGTREAIPATGADFPFDEFPRGQPISFVTTKLGARRRDIP